MNILRFVMFTGLGIALGLVIISGMIKLLGTNRPALKD